MNPNIRALANLIRDKKDQTGKKFVVMLGAGASLSAGVRPTKEIMEELLEKYEQGPRDGELRDRFDRLWARHSPEDREMFLQQYLKLAPTEGHWHLAHLLIQGYFDVVITFNFDRLLEKALNEEGCRDEDVQVIVRGDHTDEFVENQMARTEPRIKILKLHGSLRGETFLFTRKEMNNYPERIKRVVRLVTRPDMIVCGYAFEDLCVERSFSEEGGNIYCVNPAGPPSKSKKLLEKRNSTDCVFDKEHGRFDNFLRDLRGELTGGGSEESKPRMNPFKFLESYEVRDKDWFLGRPEKTSEVIARFQSEPAKVIHLVGPPKSGKTSFVRAGLMANLDPDRFRTVYLRCQSDLKTWLPKALERLLPDSERGGTAEEMIRKLAASDSRYVLLILDQFERVVNHYEDTEPGRKQLLACLDGLCQCACRNLGFLCVGVDDKNYLRALLSTKADSIDLPPLDAETVRSIIEQLSERAGVQFEPQVIQAIAKQYGDTMNSNRPFSLAHVQSVCNILAGSAQVDLVSFKKVMQDDAAALDQVLNECDIISFVEDIPYEAERNLVRNILKVISVPSKRWLATYLKEHFTELFTEAGFPERAGDTQSAGKAAGHGST